MSYGGIISQGKFTQAYPATVQFIEIPSGVDRMVVENYSASEDLTTGDGFRYTWQRGMATDTGLLDYFRTGGAGSEVVANGVMASGGFTLVDSSSQVVGAGVNINSITSGTTVVLNVSSTAGIVDGVSVVRILKPTGKTLADGETVIGKDFLVASSVANTSINLVALATNPLIGAGTAQYKVVYTETAFYPRARIIANIQAQVDPTVTTTVPHGMTIGQKIRFRIPSTSGMVQLNPTTDNQLLSATVKSITNSYQFVIDTDTTGFTAFTYPTSAQDPVSFPYMVPFGMDSATAIAADVEISAGARVNTAKLGMILGLGADGTGAKGPAGDSTSATITDRDVMYWHAWKAANVTQE